MPASPLSPSFASRYLLRPAKWLGCFALVVYLCLALGFLTLRYWALPNIDHWREPLQHHLSEVLPVQVEIGRVSAQWRGRHPHFSLHDTVLRDESGRTLLEIREVDALVAWHSVFSGAPQFLKLSADGLQLSVRRDANDRISLVGYEMVGADVAAPDPADHAESGSGAEVLRWLAAQGTVMLTNARILWLDERRSAPPLLLQDVVLGVTTHGDEHRFSLVARPPETLGESFRLQAQLRLNASQGAVVLSDVSGLFHFNVEDMRPRGWAPWFDVRDILEEGRISWQAWQEVADGVPGHHVSTVEIKHGVWRPDASTRIAADSAKLHVSGQWRALHEVWFGPDAADEPRPPASGRTVLQLSGLSADANALYAAPLNFDSLELSSVIHRSAANGLMLDVTAARLRNADMDVSLAGAWRQQGGGVAGVADMRGEFHRAQLAAIVKYLPNIVDQDARDWMTHGLLAGRLVNAPVRLSGDLVYFPFGEHPDRGDFFVGGPIRDVVIDYAPASAVGAPGWPKLEQLEGYASLNKVDLSIRADTMQMRPGGQPITLTDVLARIPNIEEDAILSVEGVGRAEGQALVSLVQASPLARLLGGLLDQATAKGHWQVPIALQIPLVDTDKTTVKGSIILNQAGLQIAPSLPPLDALTGRLSFTDQTLLAHDVKGEALGGAVSISGGLGKGQKALSFSGRLHAEALDTALTGALGGLVTGNTAYTLSLQRDRSGAIGARFDAPLEGMAINLPIPLSKSATQRLPLKVQWQPATGKSGAKLDIDLANGLTVRLLNGRAKKGQAFFQSGAVSFKGKAVPPSVGMAADIIAPSIDIDAWRKVLEGTAEAGGESPRMLLPELRDLRLQAARAQVFGTQLDHLTFTARRPDDKRWRVDVSSTQTAGTLFWQVQRGAVAGEVHADFQRLTLGSGADDDSGMVADDSPLLNPDDEVDIPAIRLKVDRLRVYGRDLGSLSVVGVNEARGRRWKLQQLEVGSPHASFKGNGVWRLVGPGRGLRLQADAMFDDLGAYLDQLGFKDLVQGGHGRVHGHIEWLNIPWNFERAGLQGDLAVDLSNGRLVNVGSRSARLLELLSLQSVKRLASFSWNPAGLMKQGFPFDTLQGNIKVNNGVLHSENYRVSSPVATIVIAGDVDLPREVMDLYAVVVPNLDVSGAAIAAGIAVNPVVGIGAFLTQWLLKNPMSRAMTVEYRVKGDFDSPSIDEVETSGEKR